MFATRAVTLALLLVVATGHAQNAADAIRDDFEAGKAGDAVTGWFVPTPDFAAELSADSPREGKLCARLYVKQGKGEFGNLMRSIDARPYREKRIRLTASLRIEKADQGKAQVWLREDRPNRQMGFFENMGERPITSTKWTECEIVGDIGPDAEALALGFMAIGGSTIYVDAFRLEVVGAAKPAQIEPARGLDDRGLENLVALARIVGYVRYFHPSDQAAEADWNMLTVEAVKKVEGAKNAAELAEALRGVFQRVAPLVRVATADATPGAQSDPQPTPQVVAWRHVGLGIGTDMKSVYQSKRHFIDAAKREAEAPWMAAPTDSNTRIDAGGVVCLVPTTLWATDGRTSPGSESQPVVKPPRFTGNDRATRLASVILAWNVFQHFYPYFDVVSVDWKAELRTALRAAATDADERAFLATLRRMVAALQDGHGYVGHRSDNRNLALPIAWDWIEDKLVITFVTDQAKAVAPELKVGSVVASINGRPAIDAIRDAEELVASSTPHALRRRALAELRMLPEGEKLTLDILAPDGAPAAVALAGIELRAEPSTPRPENYSELRPGIRYVDVDRLSVGDLQRNIEGLAAARGVVIDMRGYPGTGEAWKLLSYLASELMQSPQWHIPVFTRPDRKNMTFEQSGWPVGPAKPRIAGKVVFLIDGRAISAAETFMGIVEHYKLGEIVGETTAGTNGNINPFTVPGGYRISWTGMKVLRHDGSRHHGVGIAPTVPVQRTITGVAAQRDEFIEKAIELIEAAK